VSALSIERGDSWTAGPSLFSGPQYNFGITHVIFILNSHSRVTYTSFILCD